VARDTRPLPHGCPGAVQRTDPFGLLTRVPSCLPPSRGPGHYAASARLSTAEAVASPAWAGAHPRTRCRSATQTARPTRPVHVSAVYRAVERGELPAVRLSETGAIRIHRSVL